MLKFYKQYGFGKGSFARVYNAVFMPDITFRTNTAMKTLKRKLVSLMVSQNQLLL